VTDCLNFGSPEDPGVMWQFQQAVHGLADGCATLGVPVTGGNVSFYNQTGSTAIHPTPVVGVLGVIDDVSNRIPTGFQNVGDTVLLLGSTREELDGSEWAHVVHRHLGGRPPVVDLEAERSLATLLKEAARAREISSAHDLSEGGLAQALVEACLIGGSQGGDDPGLGADVTLPGDSFVELFSESAARVLITVPANAVTGLTVRCNTLGVPVRTLGTVTDSNQGLTIQGVGTLSCDELRAAWEGTLPALFGV
jgi:phosphoribosylformylglycinamidine synthase